MEPGPPWFKCLQALLPMQLLAPTSIEPLPPNPQAFVPWQECCLITMVSWASPKWQACSPLQLPGHTVTMISAGQWHAFSPTQQFLLCVLHQLVASTCVPWKQGTTSSSPCSPWTWTILTTFPAIAGFVCPTNKHKRTKMNEIFMIVMLAQDTYNNG